MGILYPGWRIMAVAKTVSTNSRYIVYSSVNGTVATAITEVIDALDADQVPMNQVQWSVAYDGTTNLLVTALTRRG